MGLNFGCGAMRQVEKICELFIRTSANSPDSLDSPDSVLYRIKDGDFSAFACGVEEGVSLRFYLVFGQLRFQLHAHLFESRDDAARILALKARHIDIAVIIGNLLGRDDRE